MTTTTKLCFMQAWARKGGACSGARTNESRDWSGIGSGIGPGLVSIQKATCRLGRSLFFVGVISIVGLPLTVATFLQFFEVIEICKKPSE